MTRRVEEFNNDWLFLLDCHVIYGKEFMDVTDAFSQADKCNGVIGRGMRKASA